VDGKGRHTTTYRALIPLPGGGAVLDTPGLRGVGLLDGSVGLVHAFADVDELALRCKFGDCTHTAEPGCAVQAAVQQGELGEERLASFRKLASELWRPRRRRASRRHDAKPVIDR
jgi:ribosome biogenesis GTPase